MRAQQNHADAYRGRFAVVLWCVHVAVDIEANRRPAAAGPTEPEDDTGAVLEDDSDPLLLGDFVVGRVGVLEVIDGFDDVARAALLADQAALQVLPQAVHHGVGSAAVHRLVVVPREKVAAELRPVAHEHLLNRRLLRRQDRKPAEHGPDAIFLPDMA